MEKRILLCSNSSSIYYLLKNLEKIENINEYTEITCFGNSSILSFLLCLGYKTAIIKKYLTDNKLFFLQKICPSYSFSEIKKENLNEILVSILDFFINHSIYKDNLRVDDSLEKFKSVTGFSLRLSLFSDDKNIYIDYKNFKGNIKDFILLSFLNFGFLKQYELGDKTYYNYIIPSLLKEFNNLNHYDLVFIENPELIYKRNKDILYNTEIDGIKNYIFFLDSLKYDDKKIIKYKSKIHKDSITYIDIEKIFI